MQLALAAGSLDRGAPTDALPTTRTKLVLAAGVALATAGVIAVNPVAPALSLNAHQSAVQLTSTTSDNWANLMDLLTANPDPIGHALGELSGYYEGIATSSFQDSMAGIEGIWSGMGAAKGLETVLPQIMEFLQQGDVTNAYNLINNEMLFDTLNIFQPLFDHTPHGGTEEVPGILSMGPDLTRVMANVQDVFLGDFSFWKSTAKYLTEPLIGMQFAMSDNLTDADGHVPQDPFDALLNGYVPWAAPAGSDADPHAPFIGLLSENGTFAYLFNGLPTLIANALTQNLPVDDVVDPDVGGALAGTDLFDMDWLSGLFS